MVPRPTLEPPRRNSAVLQRRLGILQRCIGIMATALLLTLHAPTGRAGPSQDDGRGWLEQGEFAAKEHRVAAATEAFQRAARLGQESGDLALAVHALQKAAIANVQHGRLDPALTLIDEAIAIDRTRSDSKSEPRLLNIKGAVLQRRGEPEKAIAAYAHGIELAETYRDEEIRIVLLNNIAVLSMSSGAYEEALDFLGRVESAGRENGDKFLLSAALTNRGDTLHLMRRYAESLACLEEALLLRRELGNEPQLAETLTGLGFTLADMGQGERSLALLDEALEITDRLDLKLQRIAILAAQAETHAAAGDAEQALLKAQASLAAMEGSQSFDSIGLVQQALSKAHRAAGDVEQARAHMRDALTIEAEQKHAAIQRQFADLQLEVERLEAQRAANQRRWLIAVVAGGALLVGLLVGMLLRERKRSRTELEALRGQVDAMNLSLQLNATALELAAQELASIQEDRQDETLRPG